VGLNSLKCLSLTNVYPNNNNKNNKNKNNKTNKVKSKPLELRSRVKKRRRKKKKLMSRLELLCKVALQGCVIVALKVA
jgi:hypothetical protein